MNLNIDKNVIDRIRALYQSNDLGRIFFDWAASRQRDARATTIETIMSKCSCGRADAVSLARQLHDGGCGEFLYGRRGAASRVRWSYSLISLGRAAAGETGELETVDKTATEDVEEEETASEYTEGTSAQRKSLSIIEAKEALAQSLGVSPTNIEITIKA